MCFVMKLNTFLENELISKVQNVGKKFFKNSASAKIEKVNFSPQFATNVTFKYLFRSNWSRRTFSKKEQHLSHFLWMRKCELCNATNLLRMCRYIAFKHLFMSKVFEPACAWCASLRVASTSRSVKSKSVLNRNRSFPFWITNN